MNYKIIAIVLCFFSVSALTALVDGDLDPTFGTGGFATILSADFGGGTVYARSIAIQQDGKIIVCVWQDAGESGIFLVRLTTTGALDTSFNAGGGTPGIVPVTTDTTIVRAGGIVLDAQDNIIITGKQQVGPDNTFVARYIGTGGSAGTLDTTFNAGGGTPGVLDTGITTSQGIDCVVDSQGRIVITAADISGGANSYVARILADGTLDATFGIAGVVTFTDAGYAILYPAALKIAANGSIFLVLTGFTGGATESILLCQFSGSDGSLIAPFNPYVPVFTAPAVYAGFQGPYTGIVMGRGLVIGSNNNLYIYGVSRLTETVTMFSVPVLSAYFGMLGITSVGALASSFAYNGQLVTGLAPANNLLPFSTGQTDLSNTYRTPYTGRLLQVSNNKFVTVGYDTEGIGFIARLNSNGTFDSTFSGGGTPLPGVIPTTLTNTSEQKFYIDAATQSNGYILTAGGIGFASPNNPNSTAVLVARYFVNSSLVCPSSVEEQLNQAGGGLSCAIIKKYATAGSSASACACTPVPNGSGDCCS